MNKKFEIKTGKEGKETLTAFVEQRRMLVSITFTLKDHQTQNNFDLKTLTSFDVPTAFETIRYLKNWLPGTKYLKTGISLDESLSFCDEKIIDGGELVIGKKVRIFKPNPISNKKPHVAITTLTKKQAQSFVEELEKYAKEFDTSSTILQKKLDAAEKRIKNLEETMEHVLSLMEEWEEEEEQFKEPLIIEG